MSAAAPTISDEWIAERWPDQDVGEVRRRFDALMNKLGETPWRGFPAFAETMANVLASTARLPEERLADVAAALADVPEHLREYEWFAGNNPVFGEHFVYGDDGHGMGRQAIAGCPGGKRFNLAPFIAAASPKNVAAMLAEIAILRARRDGLLDANNREVERRRELFRALDALREAGRALYMAGRWKLCPASGSALQLSDAAQAHIWERFRDALGLKPGTATAAGLGAEPATNLCPYCADKPDCECEPPLPFDRPGAEL
jgi:hypothetical protein